VRWYQEGKTNLDFTEVRDSEWQWHQLGHMQICTLLQTNNHASIPPLGFLQAGCPSSCPTNSVKALKASISKICIFIARNSLIVEFDRKWVLRLRRKMKPVPKMKVHFQPETNTHTHTTV